MDRLEKYIHQHRDEFDSHSPDPAVWSAIEAHLPQRKQRRITIWQITSVAAVGLVLLLSGVIVGMRMTSDDMTSTAEYIEFREAEQYYNSQLQKRVSALSTYTYDSSIDDDLLELQEVYDQLTTELEDGMEPNKNDIILALIQNYQTRISLLERVLDRLEEGQNQIDLSNDEDEPVKI